VTFDGLAYASAVALAALLLIAAAAKLLAPAETERSFAALAVPNPAAAARFVPLPEAAAAVLLVVVPAVGAIATLMLLAFFSTFVVSRLRAGVVAPCACFGAASTAPLSWLTLARNVALALLGFVALGTMRPVLPTWPDVLVVAAYVGTVATLLRLGERRSATARG
jgi:hypothetical protein